MYAYEFQTVVNNGMIQIPIEYRNKISNRVKIIVLSEEVQTASENKKTEFSAMELDTTGFLFDREFANER